MTVSERWMGRMRQPVQSDRFLEAFAVLADEELVRNAISRGFGLSGNVRATMRFSTRIQKPSYVTANYIKLYYVAYMREIHRRCGRSYIRYMSEQSKFFASDKAVS